MDDLQYDKAGRLSAEDELMMANPSKDISNVIGCSSEIMVSILVIVDTTTYFWNFCRRFFMGISLVFVDFLFHKDR
jgi:hypothetical protein